MHTAGGEGVLHYDYQPATLDLMYRDCTENLLSLDPTKRILLALI